MKSTFLLNRKSHSYVFATHIAQYSDQLVTFAQLVEPTGIRDVELIVGGSYARLAGVAHNVININDYEFSFVEIEIK